MKGSNESIEEPGKKNDFLETQESSINHSASTQHTPTGRSYRNIRKSGSTNNWSLKKLRSPITNRRTDEIEKTLLLTEHELKDKSCSIIPLLHEGRLSSTSNFIDPICFLETRNGDNLSEKTKHFSWTLSLCVAYTLLDIYHINLLIENVLEMGGICFLVAYYIMSMITAIPIYDFYLSSGKFIRTGVTNIVGVVCPILRFLGVIMTLMIIIHQTIGINNIGERASFMSEYAKSPADYVSCPLSVTGTNVHSRLDMLSKVICRSVYTECPGQTSCVEENRDDISYAAVLINADVLTRLKHMRFDFSFAATSIISIVFILFLLLPGPFFFSCALSATYAITCICAFVTFCNVITVGKFEEGMLLLYRKTDPEHFFQMKTIHALIQMTVLSKCGKFSLISIGTMFPKSSNPSLIAIVSELATLFFHTIYIYTTLTVMGSFEYKAYDYSPVCNGTRSYSTLLPEFYSTSPKTSHYSYFLHVQTEMLVAFGQVACPCFVLYTLLNDQFSQVYSTRMKYILFCLFFLFGAIPICIGGVLLHRIDAGKLPMLYNFFSSFTIVAVLLAMRFMAGPREILMDSTQMYRRAHIDAEAATYHLFHFLRHAWASKAMIIISFCCIQYFVLNVCPVYDIFYEKNLDNWLDRFIALSFLIIGFSMYCVELYAIHNKPVPPWRVFYPNRNHPLYSRILFAEGGKGAEMPKMSKEQKDSLGLLKRTTKEAIITRSGEVIKQEGATLERKKTKKMTPEEESKFELLQPMFQERIF